MASAKGGWLEASDVVAMFPTMVWKLRLAAEPRQAVEAEVLALIDELRKDLPPPGAGEGWQSERALHRREALRELVRCIDEATRGVLRFLRIGDDAFEITGCWANALPPGAAHRFHSHPNNFLSGVYYVRTFPGADTINFHDPRPQTGVIRPPVVALTAENTDQVVVEVEDGTLLLFPAYLPHSVDANTGPRERVSISFNIMFSAFTERISSPLW
jgi:uncharacterized protein (TIGR02466 family)